MIVKVHDGYGRVLYVEQNDLDNTRRNMLPLYTKGGVRYSYLPPSDRRAKGATCILRTNICLHDPKTYKWIRIYRDDPKSKHCPICTPHLNEYNLE